jgi:glycosyltransferase involved in cell wall biosynthesis
MKILAKTPVAFSETKSETQPQVETKKIRVLHILDVEINCYIWKNLCAYTDEMQAELVFVNFRSQNSEFVKAMKARGVRVYALDSTERKQYPRAVKQLWRIIKNERPDVVHTHLFDPTLIGLTLAKIQGIKVVVTRHHSDAVHKLKSKTKRFFYSGLEKYVNFCADHLIALSRYGRDILIEKENVSPEKVSLIPNGQTTERFEKISAEAVNDKRRELKMDGRLTIVFTARLYPKKGHIYLFQALSPMIKNGFQARLYLVGRGDYQEQLEKLAVDYGIQDNVEFLGWRTDALEIAAAADLIVHPSLEDALSSAVIEALMLSRPIVAADISGVRDILDDGKYGEIVPPADSNAIRQAIEKISQNLEQAREKAKNGRQYILDNMGAEQFANGYIECYKKVLAKEKQ